MDYYQHNILLVEDDEMIRELFVSEFQSAGLQINGAADGTHGMQELRTGKYDVLLLDIMLPDTNGLELLKTIKSDPVLQKTKVIMMTNLGNDQVLSEAMQAGAAGYLVKANFNPDEMIQQVKKIISTEVTA